MTGKDALRRFSLLVGRRNLYRVSRFLMYAARGDVANDSAMNGERITQDTALRASAPPATIFDVGANVGEWSASLLEAARNLHVSVSVHAFEPCSETFKILSERLANSPELTLVNKACSQRDGTATMHVYGSGAGTNSLGEPVDGRIATTEEVQITSIDLYCKENAISKIDLVKIDAEGHDFQVISGASEMLDRQAIRILQFEYNFRWIACRSYLRDAFGLLNAKGYKIGKLTGSQVEFYPNWHWDLENWAEGNYIACAEQDMSRFQRREPAWLQHPVQEGEDDHFNFHGTKRIVSEKALPQLSRNSSRYGSCRSAHDRQCGPPLLQDSSRIYPER